MSRFGGSFVVHFTNVLSTIFIVEVYSQTTIASVHSSLHYLAILSDVTQLEAKTISLVSHKVAKGSMLP